MSLFFPCGLAQIQFTINLDHRNSTHPRDYATVRASEIQLFIKKDPLR